MSPVLSYGRSDRYDRELPKDRSGSPTSNESSSSGNSQGRSRRPSFSATNQLLNFISPRSRLGSEPVISSSRAISSTPRRSSAPVEPGTGATGVPGYEAPEVSNVPAVPEVPESPQEINGHPSPPLTPPPSSRPDSSRPGSTKAVDIQDYCLGKPRKVAQSRSGQIELYVCLQEDALYLPTVKSHTRRRRRHGHRYVPETHPEVNETLDDPPETGEAVYGEESEDEEETQTPQAVAQSISDAESSEVPPAPVEPPQLQLSQLQLPIDVPPSIDVPSATPSQPPQYSHYESSSCATLRGSVLLKLQKPTKIKQVGVSFYCMSSTLWNLLPQSSLLMDHTGHNTAQVEDTAYLGIHYWDFVPLEQFGPAQAGYNKTCGQQSGTLIGQDLFGADVAVFKDSPNELQQREFTRLSNSSATNIRQTVPVFGPLRSQPRKLKQSSVHADGVVFPAGSYVYNFTLLVDAKTPGSATLSNGQVKFALAAKVYRSGAFTMNVGGSLGVEVVHVPLDFTEGEYSGPQNDQVLLSRVWEDMFLYYVNLEHRSMTLDVPTQLSISLVPLTELDIRVHKIQVFIAETATYVYSLDSSIKYVDPSLRLLLSQKTAPSYHGPTKGSAGESLMHPTEPNLFNFPFTLASEHNRNLRSLKSQPYMRGRFGELRFLSPDVKGPYVRVKHKLQVLFHVSRPSSSGRNHYEVKFETRVHVLSRHCVPATLSLPMYTAAPVVEMPRTEDEEQFPVEALPSFQDAMEHDLLGPSGERTANTRGTKAEHSS